MMSGAELMRVGADAMLILIGVFIEFRVIGVAADRLAAGRMC